MTKLVFEDKSIDACYGCTACQQVCAHNAIQMVPNEEGFLYPQIDTHKCIDCKLCTKVCPTQNKNIYKLFNKLPKTVYASWQKLISERLESTSGGVFFALASQFISDGGVVYGVCYNQNLLAIHQRIDNLENLGKTRGSKYMQSDINSTYQQVKKDLKNGLSVLFSGTPCQIAGLRLYLLKDYAHLTTVDFVCHGVPSPSLFQEHKAWIEKKYNKKLVDFKFRAKDKEGWRSYVRYIFEGNVSKSLFLSKDYYSHSFHIGYFNRLSCFECAFSKGERISDITLSDFWNSEKFSRILKRQRKFGYNLVMCNTEKGKRYFDFLRDKLEILEIPVQIATEGDVRLRHTEQCPPFRKYSYKILKEKGYDYMVKKFGAKTSFIQLILPIWIKNLVREIQSIL